MTTSASDAQWDYTREGMILNLVPDDQPAGAQVDTPLKRVIYDNPDRPIYVETHIGDVWVELDAARARDFIDACGHLVCGFVRPALEDDPFEDLLELQQFVNFEYLLDD